MRAWWLAFVLAGCVAPDSVPCGDLVCPGGTTCSPLTNPDETICATSEQVAACASAAEGDMCSYRDSPPSWCHDGVCIAIVCGNNRVDATEACDDGNTLGGDRVCAADCSSNEQCGNGTVDPFVLEGAAVVTNEECDDANKISGDGCSSTCKAEEARWTRLAEVPVPQLGSAMAYDTVRQRILMFGGVGNTNTDRKLVGGFYEWNGTNWGSIPTTIGPAQRYYAAMAYDSARRKLVLFGGRIGEVEQPVGDLWEWDGTSWELLTPAVSPSARTHATMVYDSARKKTVLFGGYADDGTSARPSNDTWEWDGVTWTKIAPGAMNPGPRHNHVMAYDPKRAVVVMAGGYDEVTGTYWRDTWEYNGTWTKVPAPKGTAPADLDSQSTLAYDPGQSRLIAFGGIQPATNTVSTRTWKYDALGWTDLGDATPGGRFGAGAATDLRTGSIVLFGGMNSSLSFVDTTWRWTSTPTSGAWSGPVTPFVPVSSYFSAAANDPLHARVWVFGGLNSNRLLSFDGSSWTQHLAVGPTPRTQANLAYDPLRGELVMFGGSVDDPNSIDDIPTNETWIFDGTSWSAKTPATSPAPRLGAAMYFDLNRGRVVLVSGFPTVTGDAELWEWTGTTWQSIPSTLPLRAFASVAFDSARGACVLYSGVGTTFGEFGDTWHFDGTTWTRDLDTSSVPTRTTTAIAYYPTRRNEVLFAGAITGSSVYDDTWQFDGSSWQQLAVAQSPPARGAHVLFPAPDGSGLVAFAGFVRPQEPRIFGADTWRFRFDRDSPREQCLLTVDDDRDGLSGCADPDCWAYCDPLCPPGTAMCPATAPRCGDGACNTSLESCRNCPGDCPTCTAACGDGFCDAGESLGSCPGDCTP